MRRDVATLLGRHCFHEQHVADELLYGLQDDDNDVRTACAMALAQWAKFTPEYATILARRLSAALTDTAFAKQDNTETPAYDYVYQALDQLLTALPRLGSTPNNPGK